MSGNDWWNKYVFSLWQKSVRNADDWSFLQWSVIGVPHRFLPQTKDILVPPIIPRHRAVTKTNYPHIDFAFVDLTPVILATLNILIWFNWSTVSMVMFRNTVAHVATRHYSDIHAGGGCGAALSEWPRAPVSRRIPHSSTDMLVDHVNNGVTE